MDALSRILSQIHLEGAVFLSAEFSSPWSIVTPDGQRACRELMPHAEHLILFHWVTKGQCQVIIDQQRTQTASQGQMILLPHGTRHRLASDVSVEAARIEELLAEPRVSGSLPVIEYGGGGESCSLLCGFLACNPISAQPLLGSLPTALISPAPTGLTGVMSETSRFAQLTAQASQQQPGAEAVLAKLCELMFIEVVRSYLSELTADHPSWLSSLNDPVTSRALSEIHAHLAEPWDLDRLADRAGASRSVVDERFRTFLGCSPIRYVTKARIRAASDLIRRTSLTLSQIADAVGYRSQAAFSRAYQREIGSAPSQLRKASSKKRTVV